MRKNIIVIMTGITFFFCLSIAYLYFESCKIEKKIIADFEIPIGFEISEINVGDGNNEYVEAVVKLKDHSNKAVRYNVAYIKENGEWKRIIKKMIQE